jgi:hypothetical protein
MFTKRFIPNATPVHENWFDDLQRVSTSPANAARLIEVDSGIDVAFVNGFFRGRDAL